MRLSCGHAKLIEGAAECVAMAVAKESLIVNTDRGLYCPLGDFYIDPWKAVDRALITHAHSDHARSGSKNYLTAGSGLNVLRSRLGAKSKIETVEYGQNVTIGGVNVSFHSAGHVLGSSQIRVEHRGRVWVVSGDYKTRTDPTCAPFELLKCHCFITESTFGLPIYRWPDPSVVANELNTWWENNRKNGRTSIVYAYSFGKAQRLLAMADPTIGPIMVHETVDKMNAEYRASGVKLPQYSCANNDSTLSLFGGALVVAPPSASGNIWAEKFSDYEEAFASGWMRIRGNRKRQSLQRGFVLSDHADWSELLEVISQTRAEEVIVTHGYIAPLVRYLKELGINAKSFRTRYAGELDTAMGANASDPDIDFEREVQSIVNDTEPAVKSETTTHAARAGD